MFCPVCGPDFVQALDDCCDYIEPEPAVRAVDVSTFADAVADGFEILFTWEDKDDDLQVSYED